ncbi:MAG TPA: nuclear transport factor 2 family protein [Casimicrobiaceae bacterium]|nr:nuclear transport factor 2 family protein [Casimicrobiaceae bacterium]
MKARLAASIALLVLCACNAAPPPLSAADVQQFVRDYVAANNAGDPTKVMSMVLHDASASSISGGKIDRGWEAIQVSAAGNVERRQQKIELQSIEVTPLSADTAVAVGTLNLRGTYHIGNMVLDTLPGALTIVVKRTPEGLRLVHEHYSIRTK